jgi:hypothetical protein
VWVLLHMFEYCISPIIGIFKGDMNPNISITINEFANFKLSHVNFLFQFQDLQKYQIFRICYVIGF